MGAVPAANVELARTPSVQVALGALMEQFGGPPIDPAELARIAVPTTLIWGRHDLATRLAVAEAASADYGWPLHVIEDCADDPPIEQPEAFVAALRTASGRRRHDRRHRAGRRAADRAAARVLLPGEPGFEDATRLWNGMIETTPALVVQASGTADVVAAVGFAREHGLALPCAAAATTSPAPRSPTAA